MAWQQHRRALQQGCCLEMLHERKHSTHTLPHPSAAQTLQAHKHDRSGLLLPRSTPCRRQLLQNGHWYAPCRPTNMTMLVLPFFSSVFLGSPPSSMAHSSSNTACGGQGRSKDMTKQLGVATASSSNTACGGQGRGSHQQAPAGWARQRCCCPGACCRPSRQQQFNTNNSALRLFPNTRMPHLLDDLLLVQPAGQLLHVHPLLHVVAARGNGAANERDMSKVQSAGGQAGRRC